MTDIIIFGWKGMLGRYMYKYLSEQQEIKVIGYGREELDIFDSFTHGHLYSDLKDIVSKDSVIINCAGITNKRPDIYTFQRYVLNTIFPMILDRICHENKAQLIHISTDCVFNGERGNYTEIDEPDSTDSYGMSKQLGERLNHSLVIRTSIIGEELGGKPSGLLEWVRRSGKSIAGYTNHFWNGVTCLELAKIIHYNLSLWQWEFKDRKSLIQITSEPTSKYKLVKLIADVYNLEKNIEPYETLDKCDKSLRGSRTKKSLRKQLEELREFNLKSI